MNDRTYRQARKIEPGFDIAGPYSEVSGTPPARVAPAPAPAAPVPAAAGRFKRAALFWGGSLAALAVAFGGTLWLFDERGSDRPADVAAISSLAPMALAPLVSMPADAPLPARGRAVPPLVLLAPAPAPAAIALAAAPPPHPAPVKKAPPAAPHKAPLARSVPLQARVKAMPAVPRKAQLAAKTAPAPARVKPRPALLAAVARKCQPGELASACAGGQ